MSFFTGSLTLHHWQQLAKPHLATILDPHPGVVTKGFCPLPQDAIYRLSDMEEDEADDQRGSAVLEKGASEKGKEEDDEEEEGGITFKVRSSSTPDERRDRKHTGSPLPVPPITPNTLTAPKGDMSSHSPVTCPEKSSQSSQPIPGACATMVQPQSQICTSTSTATSSSGIYFLNPSLNMQNSTRTVFLKKCNYLPFSPQSRQVPEFNLLHLYFHNLPNPTPQ